MKMHLKYKRLTAIVGLVGLVFSGSVTATNASAAPKSGASTSPAVEQYYDTVREGVPGLPEHTVYRPADLKQFDAKSVPVVIWGNGACRSSNWGFTSTLTLLASHGFVVIAVGAPEARAVDGTGGVPQPERLTEAIDWAIDNNKREFKNRLDESKIAVAGQSCGGLESLVAGADPRVKSVASVNSGFFPTPYNGYGREELENLHTPTLIVNGGPSDVAYQNSIDTYNLLDVPAVLVENSHAGHSGLWYGIRDGEGDTTMITAGVDLLTHWLDFTLNDTEESRQYLTGENCTLCEPGGDWVVQSKGF